MKLCLIDPINCITHPTKSEKVTKYLKALENDANFPPIEVVEYKGKYVVRDGNHRTMAHLAAGELIWAYVFTYEEYPNKWLLGARLGKLLKE